LLPTVCSSSNSILYRQPGLYVATPEGLRWCGITRLGVHRLSPATFVHTREVASIAVELQLALSDWQVLSEREIRFAESESARVVGSARVGELPDGRPALHRPDLLGISPAGRAVAVEVELSIKQRRRLLAICRGWARARHIAATYYLTAPAPGRAVERAVAELRADDRITVLALDEVRALVSREQQEAHGGAVSLARG
jgi:hypothetical protein